MKDFEKKAHDMCELVEKQFDASIVVIDEVDGENRTVMLNGTTPQLLAMFNTAITNLRDLITKNLGEPIANELIPSVIMTREELADKVMEDVKKSKGRIPDFLRKLMERSEDDEEADDDDDAEDEQGDCDDTPDFDEQPEYMSDDEREKAITKTLDYLRELLRYYRCPAGGGYDITFSVRSGKQR